LDLFAVLLGGATALLPIYARDILGTGPWGLGLLRAAPACGALAMSVVLTRRPVERGAGPAFFAGLFVYGAATIVFGVSTSLGLSLAALSVLGASDLFSVVIRQSLVQIRTPVDMRGRVSPVHSLFTGTSTQLGEFEAGLLAGLLGPRGQARQLLRLGLQARHGEGLRGLLQQGTRRSGEMRRRPVGRLPPDHGDARDGGRGGGRHVLQLGQPRALGRQRPHSCAG